MNAETLALMKEQMQEKIARMNGQVVRFCADEACRKVVAVVVLLDPAFSIGDDMIPRLAGFRAVPSPPGGGRIAFAKIGHQTGLPVKQDDGGKQEPLVFYVKSVDIPADGAVEITGYALGVNKASEASTPLDGQFASFCGVVSVTKKEDKDAAFAEARAALPATVADYDIKECTEHGKDWSPLADSATIPDAEPGGAWLDPKAVPGE